MVKLTGFKKWKKEILAQKSKLLLSLIFLSISIILYHYAGLYVDKSATNTVGDLIIDHTKPLNLEFLYGSGFKLMLLVFFLYPLFFCVKNLYVVITQYSLLLLVRNAFICLTHLKTPIDAVYININNNITGLYGYLGFNNDLFFSGHTAFPFLGFLIFKGHKIRWFFLAASIILGATVLLIHAHYSIDVFAAPFITYGVYKFGEWVLKPRQIR